jgi:Tfp pilus assembly protein PilP
MNRLALIALLIGSSANAQTDQPGQVRMQIPLGGQAAQPAAGTRGQPAAARPGTQGTGAAGTTGVNPFPNGQAAPAAPVSQVYTSEAAMDTLLTEEVIRGLRDPFAPPATVTKKEAPKSELELIDLKDFRLNGVITGPRKVRAMVSTSGGSKTFFLAVGDKLGLRSGRVTAIKSDLIKVVEYETDDRGRRIPEVFELRINGEIVSLSRKDED